MVLEEKAQIIGAEENVETSLVGMNDIFESPAYVQIVGLESCQTL